MKQSHYLRIQDASQTVLADSGYKMLLQPWDIWDCKVESLLSQPSLAQYT